MIRSYFFGIIAVLFLSSCLEQYRPGPYWDQWEQERINAMQKAYEIPSDDGSMIHYLDDEGKLQKRPVE